jgi:release factor glutamine methyltransferase
MGEREPVTTLDYVNLATKYFSSRDIENPRLNAELLLGDVIGMRRIDLYVQFDRPVAPLEIEQYRDAIKRRGAGEPLQYILGHAEFYGRTFAVSPGVLIPRPETETLVERSLGLLKDNSAPNGVASSNVAPGGVPPDGAGARRVLDIGTGSGAIAITMAAELPDANVVATDISSAALDIARNNAESLGVADRIDFREGDLFAPLAPVAPVASVASVASVAGEVFDAVISNPPYVGESERDSLAVEVRDHEPSEALFAGNNGLDTIRRIVAAAPEYVAPGGFCALEVGMGQPETVRALWSDAAPDWLVEVTSDLAGIERIVVARRPV